MWNPTGVDLHQFLAGRPTAIRVVVTDQHAVRILQILNGGAFGQEFRVGQDFKPAAPAISLEYGPQ